MKRPTRARFAALGVFNAALDDLLTAFAAGLLAALAARLGARGVTVAGAFGKPFAAVFFAGPGRFKLFL